MSKKATRALVSAVVLTGALGFLLFTTMKEDVQAFKNVDEVAQNPHVWYGKHVILHGYVTGTVMVKPNTLEYKFDVQNNGQTIQAFYTGVVPDTFKTGAEVVVKGRLDAKGFLVEHDGVTAKCPSKYTESKPGQ